MMGDILYTIENLEDKELLSFLREIDSDVTLFYPISRRVDLFEYSRKLILNATHFCARNHNNLIGLISVYLNDCISKIGYITLVHVCVNFRNYGIASNLLDQVIVEAKKYGFKIIDLEVYIQNRKAINLYQKKGFFIKEEKKDSYIMRHILSYD